MLFPRKWGPGKQKKDFHLKLWSEFLILLLSASLSAPRKSWWKDEFMCQTLWSLAAGWNVPILSHWEKKDHIFCPCWAKPEWAKLPLTVLMLQDMQQMKKSLLQLLGQHQTFLLCEVQSCCYQLDCATVLLCCPDWKHTCRKGCGKHEAICRVSAPSSVTVLLIFGGNWSWVGALQNPPASVP